MFTIMVDIACRECGGLLVRKPNGDPTKNEKGEMVFCEDCGIIYIVSSVELELTPINIILDQQNLPFTDDEGRWC